MAYLTIDDLKTHIYAENRDEIVRNDAAIINEAIDTSIDEAKGYLRKYHLIRIFGSETIEPNIVSPALKDRVKDLVVWRLVKLGNPNINYEAAEKSYDAAIKWFEKVQAGKIDPGFPMPPDDPTTDYDENDTIQWSSNLKRNNYY